MPDRPAFDPYAVLGVSRDASPLQVARAHRKLAKRYHPDVHPDPQGASRMRRINEAWQILSDRARRADYDDLYPAAGTRAGASSAGHWAGNPRSVGPAQPTTTRNWATWRATAEETRAAPRTIRAPGEIPIPATRRPQRPEPVQRTFRDSGWAAVLVAMVLVVLLLTAIVAGKVAGG